MDGWGELIQTVSIAVTAYFAVAGLRVWLAQMIGKRRFEIAGDAVLAAYRVRESYYLPLKNLGQLILSLQTAY